MKHCVDDIYVPEFPCISVFSVLFRVSIEQQRNSYNTENHRRHGNTRKGCMKNTSYEPTSSKISELLGSEKRRWISMQAVSNSSVLQPMRSAARKRMLRAAFAVVSMSIPISFWILAALMIVRISAKSEAKRS